MHHEGRSVHLVIQYIESNVGRISSFYRVMPPVTSEHFPRLLGSSPIPPSSSLLCVHFQLRALPSTGSLPGFFGTTDLFATPNAQPGSRESPVDPKRITARASRVASARLCLYAIANTRQDEGDPFAHTLSPRLPFLDQPLLTLRPACSPSRLNDPLHRRLQPLRFLHDCSDCYRGERTSSRGGICTHCGPTPAHGAHNCSTRG